MGSDTFRRPSYVNLLLRWLEQNRLLCLRLPIVFGVLLATIFLARKPLLIELALPFVLVGGLAVMRWPSLGIIAALLLIVVVPFAIGTGTETSINFGLALVGALTVFWLLDMLLGREVRLVASRTNLPLIAFVIVAILAFFAGQIQWFPTSPAPMRAQIGGLAIFLLAACVYLLVGNRVENLVWLKRMTWLFLSLGAIYLAGRWVSPLGRFVTPLFAIGSLLWIWLAALAGGQAFFNESLGLFKRFALIVLVLMTLATGWLQARAWISGWLPPLTVLLVLLWLRSWRLGLVVSVAGLLYVAIWNRDLPSMLFGLKDYSIMTRDVARNILMGDMFKADPILGLGWANYYWYTPLFSILGYNVQFNSHNQYVDIILQTGLVGLACYSWFVIAVGRTAWELRNRVPAGFARAYVYGAQAGLIGMLVSGALGDWVIPFVYNVGFTGFRSGILGWLFLGGLLAIENMSRREQPALSDA